MKVWTGRYWMTNKHRRKISNGLKKHYKDNVVWNKGKKFVDEPSYRRLRRDKKYYLNELKKNAFRRKEKGYDSDPDRIKQIKEAEKKRKDFVGYPQARRWEDDEIEYLQNHKGEDYSMIAIELNRSYSAICHKMERLKLTKYNKWT